LKVKIHRVQFRNIEPGNPKTPRGTAPSERIRLALYLAALAVAAALVWKGARRTPETERATAAPPLAPQESPPWTADRPLYEELFARIHDGSYLGRFLTEPDHQPALHYLLEQLQEIPDEQLARHAHRETPFRRFNEPDFCKKMRGEVFHLEGWVEMVVRGDEGVLADNPAEVARLDYVDLVSVDKDNHKGAYHLYLLDAGGTEPGSEGSIDAVFLKVVADRGPHGPRFRPAFVGKTFRQLASAPPAPSPTASREGRLSPRTIAVVAGIVLAFGLLLWKSRRNERKVRERLLERVRLSEGSKEAESDDASDSN
jgi:hypothetical protein